MELSVTVCHTGLSEDEPPAGQEQHYTPTIAFRHLPPNSARFGYATEGALDFISAQLSTDTISALGLGTDNPIGSNLAPKHPRKHKMHPPRVKKRKEFRLDSNDFVFICAGVSNMSVRKQTSDIK